MSDREQATSYLTPQPTAHPAKRLVVTGGQEDGSSFTFFDRLVIGRHHEGRQTPGLLLIDDATVSSRHCVITQDPDGRCFVRDCSRNGTRLDGRRLSPNLTTEIRAGQVISVGREIHLRLEGDEPNLEDLELGGSMETLPQSQMTTVTVLVGDIRDYTVTVRQADQGALQASVARLFQRFERAVAGFGGTLKEFHGDAIFAYWEEGASMNHAADACRAAIGLDALSSELADDQAVWQLEDFPLHMDWALATGPVVISGHGGANALGLSMVGEPVVLAFRIEKFADESTGAIIACDRTRRLAGRKFRFREVGTRQVKGFAEAQKLHALLGEKKWRIGR